MDVPFSRFTEYFLVVAKTENLHKAADQLFISVSAVHRQIAMAEEQLGIQLFERLPNGLRLTLAGELLYADVLRWQKEFKQTAMRFNEIQGLKRGSVELGLISALSEGFVIETLANLQQQYPWLSLNIHSYDSKVIIEKIMNSEIDFGFILDPIVHAKLDVLAFMEIPIGFVMCPEHALAKHTRLTLAETLETRHIVADAPLVIHERVMALYKKQQISPVYQTLSNDIRLMISMLKQNMGIGILSYLDVYSAVQNHELIFIPIHERGIQPLTLALCAGARRQLSRISQIFIQDFSQTMENIKLNNVWK